MEFVIFLKINYIQRLTLSCRKCAKNHDAAPPSARPKCLANIQSISKHRQRHRGTPSRHIICARRSPSVRIHFIKGGDSHVGWSVGVGGDDPTVCCSERSIAVSSEISPTVLQVPLKLTSTRMSPTNGSERDLILVFSLLDLFLRRV